MTTKLRTLLVGMADPDGRDPALRAAVEIARRTGATLHAVHAYQLPAMFTMGPGMEVIDPYAPRQYQEQLLRRVEFAVHDLFPDLAVVCHAEPGSAAAVLERVAGMVRADLLLVGSTRHGRIGQAILGTTAQRVARKSSVPVLVLRATGADRRRVLLTTDLSPVSAAAYDAGLDLAEALSGSDGFAARVLMVVWTGVLPSPLPEETIERAAGEELAEFIAARAVRRYLVQPMVRFGVPHEEIVANAEEWDADLVVLGTHSRTAAERWVLGSVAESVLKRLGCSVLVVPPPAPLEPADAEGQRASSDTMMASL